MNQKVVLGIILTLLSFFATLTFVAALPVGPETLNQDGIEDRWPIWGAQNATAIAGNVSELVFYGSTITRTYQGYFGNVTGQIVLGDSSNNTLYDWTLANPQGEIYAVRSTIVPTWESVRCATQPELQDEDTRLNVNESVDEDAVNATFVVMGALDQTTRFPAADFGHPQFWVANQSVGTNTCGVALLYNSTYEPSHYFKEVVLSDAINIDPVAGFVIYTAILSHSIEPMDSTLMADGFNGLSYDFEMLVGEDGHGNQQGATATTSTYWFYLEIE